MIAKTINRVRTPQVSWRPKNLIPRKKAANEKIYLLKPGIIENKTRQIAHMELKMIISKVLFTVLPLSCAAAESLPCGHQLQI
jgi:hypothetical protein